jgi:hypothetical protein
MIIEALPQDIYQQACWLDSSAWKCREIEAAVGGPVPGVTSPYLYLGSAGSWFPWHREDSDIYAMSYHLGGAPKVWFGVKGGGTCT